MPTFFDVVETLTTQIRPLEVEHNLAWWASSTAVSEENTQRRIAADVAYGNAMGDEGAYSEVRAAIDCDDGTNSLHSRQLSVLSDAMTPQQVPADLRTELAELEAVVDSTFNSFRGSINDEPLNDNALLRTLRETDKSTDRRMAWEATKQIGVEVESQIRELARLRNRAATHLGFRDHFALALSTGELSEERLITTLEEVDRATAAPFAAWKHDLDTGLAERFGCAIGDLRSWHYDDPFFQDAQTYGTVDLDPYFAEVDLEDLTIRTYSGMGLDIRSAMKASDLLPRDRKSQHAFCIDVDHEGDVRVLCNNTPSERWAETMLHEFGHAIYDLEVSPQLPWLLRTMHPLATEGIAMLFGRLTRNPEWLIKILGVPETEVETLTAALVTTRRAALLVFARWVLVMTTFERALYEDPERDLNTLWWDLVERFQGISRPEGRDQPDWASKLHLALAPVYYQNYLYGELVASQLQACLNANFGGIVDRPAAGALLRDRFFAPGQSLRWDQLVEHVTGEPLSVRHLANELAST